MYKVEDHLLAVFNVLSKEKDMWKYVTDEQKDKFFFIINRNLSKIYPEFSLLINNKQVSKKDAMDIWFYYLYNIPYYKYAKKFWSKDEIKSNNTKNEFSKKDYNFLLEKLNLKSNDLDFLIKNFEKELKEELKYLNHIKN